MMLLRLASTFRAIGRDPFFSSSSPNASVVGVDIWADRNHRQQLGIDWGKLSSEELNSLITAQRSAQQDFTAAVGNFARGVVGLGPAIDKLAA
jgi:hypothetical protein